MLRDRIRKWLPDRDKVRKSAALRPVAHLLQRSELWVINRRSFCGAAFIGLFSAFIPVPSQMLLAAIIAIPAKVNLPISVALVWVTNPITIGPMFYAAYRLGAWIDGVDPGDLQFELSFSWLASNWTAISGPLLLGSVICGTISGALGYLAASLFWRTQVLEKWRERRARRHDQTRSEDEDSTGQ